MNTIDYKIPKIEVKVEILIDHGQAKLPEAYLLFLNEFSRYRKGQETVFEFLNKKKKFIPLKYSGTNEFLVMNLDEIIFVRETSLMEVEADQKVILFLKNHVQLEVDHFNPLPDSHSRILDYLNQESQFILFAHNGHKLFVNKHKIITLKEQKEK